jgi:hypothetical protein
MLTRILVPNPKNAFQSPAVHNTGRFISDTVAVIVCSYRSEAFKALGARSRAGRAAREKPDVPISKPRRFMTIRDSRHPASWRKLRT